MSELPDSIEQQTTGEALVGVLESDGGGTSMKRPPVVRFSNVSKWFYDQRKKERIDVIIDFNFEIEADGAGQFVVLLGPSGCGKSTILTLISGLALPDEGEVFLNGKPVTGPAEDSATVLQAYTCFPWLTVLKNVEFGLSLQGINEKDRKEIAMEYLNKVSLEDRWDAYPKQLSGGMQQRVAIARTLAVQPPIVLMDEPFGALDAQTRSDMQQMVIQLWEEERNTIIFVTHDITEALLLADRVVVLPSRPIHDFYEKRDLDKVFGHARPPALTRKPEFIALADELRERLKKAPPINKHD